MRFESTIESLQNCVVAFGNFEGMHRGHISVLEKLVQLAKENNLNSALICTSVEKHQQVLTTQQEKAFFAKKAGVDNFFCIEVNEVNNVEGLTSIIKKANPKIVVCCECCEKTIGNFINVETVPEARFEGKAINANMIKEFLDVSDFIKIKEVCAHPYIMMGVVVRGKELGRTVGMPTANLNVVENKLRPPSGVYATISDIEGGHRIKGLTNIGRRPTVDDDERITIESFLIDFTEDIYDKEVCLEIHFFIRKITKFNSLNEVKEQVSRDIKQAKGIFGVL